MYKSKYLKIQEMVSPAVYAAKGEECWRFFNPVAIKGLDKLWEKFGPYVINNWHTGGEFDGSGFHFIGEEKRTEFSGHRMWGAFDIKFKNILAKNVRIALLGEEPTAKKTYPSIKGFEEITELEYGITWFHVRFCSNTDGVLVYAP